MCKSIISERLDNGINIELYMSIYGTQYIITAFTCDYRVIETKRTSEYSNALNKFSIMRNKYQGKKA